MSFSNPSGNGNSGGQKNTYQPPHIGFQVPFKNPESKLASAMSLSSWRGTLQISIAPKLESKDENSDYVQYDFKNSVDVYLNPMKAEIFAREIADVFNGTKESGGAVNLNGNTQVFAIKGEKYGVDNICICIRKFDAEGNEVESAVYEFNTAKNVFFGITNIDTESSNVAFDRYDDIEQTLFLNAVQNYAKGQGYAIASTTCDALAYRLDYIYNSLRGEGGDNKPKNNRGSFFNNMANDSDSKGKIGEDGKGENYSFDDL